MTLQISMRFSEPNTFAVLPSAANSNNPLLPSHKARKLFYGSGRCLSMSKSYLLTNINQYSHQSQLNFEKTDSVAKAD